MQKIAIVPAAFSTVLCVLPAGTRASNDLSLAVAVCGTVSRLVHTIVSPTLASLGRPLKLMFAIVTVNSRGAASAGETVAAARISAGNRRVTSIGLLLLG